MKIKVAHLTSAHTETDDRIFFKECVSLAASGFEVHEIAVNVESRFLNGVYIHGVNVPKKGRLSRMLKAVNAVYQKAIELNADVYHFHDPELLRIAPKLKRKGKIVIYDAHEDVPRDILSKEYLRFRKPISRIAERYENRIARKLDGIIAATPFIRDRFLKINKNTVDINNYPILEELTLENNERKPGKHVCYVGVMTPVRGIRETVKALEYCDAVLHIAGKFDPPSLKAELEAMPGWKRVINHGYLNRQQIKELYASTDAGLVLLLPTESYLTSQPVKLYEYMIAGIPVVCSNFPMWIEIVEGGQFGLSADPKDPEAIAKAIQYLLDHPEEAKQMGERGKKLVLSTYNWNTEAEKLVGFYNQLLKKN